MWTDCFGLSTQTRTRLQDIEAGDDDSDSKYLAKSIRRSTYIALIGELHIICCFCSLPSTGRAYHLVSDRLWKMAFASPNGCALTEDEALEILAQSCDCEEDVVRRGRHSRYFSTHCPYIEELRHDPSLRLDFKYAWKRRTVVSDFADNAEFKRRMYQPFYTGQLAKLSDGSLAIVPASAQCDDAVFLLEVSSMLFGLRKPKASMGHHSSDIQWEVVGDAHVHGIMRGQLWDTVKDDLGSIHLV